MHAGKYQRRLLQPPRTEETFAQRSRRPSGTKPAPGAAPAAQPRRSDAPWHSGDERTPLLPQHPGQPPHPLGTSRVWRRGQRHPSETNPHGTETAPAASLPALTEPCPSGNRPRARHGGGSHVPPERPGHHARLWPGTRQRCTGFGLRLGLSATTLGNSPTARRNRHFKALLFRGAASQHSRTVGMSGRCSFSAPRATPVLSSAPSPPADNTGTVTTPRRGGAGLGGPEGPGQRDGQWGAGGAARSSRRAVLQADGARNCLRDDSGAAAGSAASGTWSRALEEGGNPHPRPDGSGPQAQGSTSLSRVPPGFRARSVV